MFRWGSGSPCRHVSLPPLGMIRQGRGWRLLSLIVFSSSFGINRQRRRDPKDVYLAGDIELVFSGRLVAKVPGIISWGRGGRGEGFFCAASLPRGSNDPVVPSIIRRGR